MTDLFFVDTNLLIYSLDPATPAKQRRAKTWLSALWRNGCGMLSAQVLVEAHAVAVRKLSASTTPSDLRELIGSFESWKPTPTNLDLIRAALACYDRYSLSWWDALIVAAAQREGCRYLLTEDLQDGQEFDGLRVVDPFVTEPAALITN